MGKIYSSAERTLIWLGKEDSTTIQIALSYLCQIVRANAPAMAKADPDLESRATGLRMYQDYTWFWKDEPVPLRDMPEVPRKVNVVNVYEPALRKLFRNDYFRRGWVIQEVAMSRDAEVYWGDGHMWYMFFSLASRLLITLEASILVYDNVAWTGANNFDSM
jgi:hypothetical protein